MSADERDSIVLALGDALEFHAKTISDALREGLEAVANGLHACAVAAARREERIKVHWKRKGKAVTPKPKRRRGRPPKTQTEPASPWRDR